MSETPKTQEYLVEVTQRVRVKLDPAKFTPDFMAEFRKSFFPFDEVSEHAEHLAQLVARGVAELSPYVKKEFVEGYGPIGEMGISAKALDCETMVV